MIDFTIQQYRELLWAMMDRDHTFQTVTDFVLQPKEKSIILRHDIDLAPKNALIFAQIQANLGIKATYYFRAVPETWNTNIITEIADLGHEIGYHYESMTTTNGNIDIAIQDFLNNLFLFREIVPINTICMHGSPLSKYNSKDLWNKYDYKKFNIVAEPYLDIDYENVLYLTDTGRRWNGDKFSVRDRVKTSMLQNYKNTTDIIFDLEHGFFPDQALFTFHPQRWSDDVVKWSKELVFQNVKNVVKRHFYVKN